MIKLDAMILNNNKLVNKNIIGINYLEKIKYLILDNLKELDKIEIDNFSADLEKNNNKLKKFNFQERPLTSYINFYKESLSKIKYIYHHDTLSIVVNGYKTISIFAAHKKDKSVSVSISKNMGLVLSNNTIASEKIASGSIILDIICDNNTLDIEN